MVVWDDRAAVLIAEGFFDEPNVVDIARNDDFRDALAGGPMSPVAAADAADPDRLALAATGRPPVPSG